MRTIAVAILFSALPAIKAEVIDRVAASIDNSVITESEVMRQIRVTAMLNSEQPDFSAEKKRETAERLVEQALIRKEIAISRYATNSAQQSDILYKVFRQRFPTETAWRESLGRYLLKDADVRSAFEWQAVLLDFVEVRFRPEVQLPDQEIRDYYEEHIKGKSTPEATPSFEEARPKIEEILTQQRIDNALDRWLGQTRTQSRIRYRREAFQ
ncbi:MAG: hypothetical protein H7Y20_17445 [Bryobacteraceae bacterium]|nr:hypothetical protein [Bryobacteraceae bacterium]